ncbi:HEAT repeat domain-containing protein [Hyalangium versicolor]|uniref:HEAT repeat domain-containing protein n=1 Tax=Hyalangium versicolor TaxID=2861190 RepID=UPI001CCD0DEF|nr:HEAT repeat domain-containing protein [Hyalangium versicolor]
MLRLRLPLFLTALLALAVASSTACSRQSESPSAPPKAPSPTAPSPPSAKQDTPTQGSAPASQPPSVPKPDAPTQTATASTPALPSPTAFAGSEKCGECHEDEHAAWSKDWHSRALSTASQKFVVGNFKDSHFKGDSSEAWMSRHDDHFFMRTLGSDGNVSEYPVQWVVGGKRMQDPVTVTDDGRWQVLPIYFHVTGKSSWVDYSEKRQGKLTPDHPFFWSNFARSAQHACLDCHTTGLDVRYDRAAHRWKTTFADAGVACESCHGPGARHAETQDPKDIVQPKHLSAELGMAVCAQCHGPRRTLFPMLDAAHRYRPGQRYEDSYQPMVLLVGGDLSGDYFSDGRPSTSSFENQALTQSLCYMKGGATCLTCHSAPHDKHAPNEIQLHKDTPARVSADMATCQGCHANVFAQGKQHSHHTSPAAQDCIACHMPPVVSGVLDHFADHAIGVPVPQNTVKHDIPNACNACHTHEKQKPEVMAQALERWWPEAKKHQERRLRLADAFTEKTAQQSRPFLEAVLADTQEAAELRGAAALFLARRFSREASPALRAALRSAQEPLLRAEIIDALAQAKARDASEDVASLLKDPSIWVRQSAAVTLTQLGDPRGPTALEILAQQPETSGLMAPHAMLGHLALRRKDLTTATRQFEQALDVQPYYSELLVMLADIYVSQGDVAKAKDRLEDAVRFSPQNQGARQRLTALQGH